MNYYNINHTLCSSFTFLKMKSVWHFCWYSLKWPKFTHNLPFKFNAYKESKTLYKSSLNLSTKLWTLSKIQGNKEGANQNSNSSTFYHYQKIVYLAKVYKFNPFSQLQLIFKSLRQTTDKQCVLLPTKLMKSHNIKSEKKNRNLYLIYHYLTFEPS